MAVIGSAGQSPQHDASVSAACTCEPGKLELYKQAIDFILPITEAKEPYVLEYKIHKNAEAVYTEHERFADEAALHRHLEVIIEGQIKWAD